MRVCTDCKKELPETEEFFGRKKTHANGLQNVCKECRRKENYEQYKKRAEKRRQEVMRLNAERAWARSQGVRSVTFPDNWKPNREGLRSNYEDKTGIASSLNV
jgi:hypothetical protein